MGLVNMCSKQMTYCSTYRLFVKVKSNGLSLFNVLGQNLPSLNKGHSCSICLLFYQMQRQFMGFLNTIFPKSAFACLGRQTRMCVEASMAYAENIRHARFCWFVLQHIKLKVEYTLITHQSKDKILMVLYTLFCKHKACNLVSWGTVMDCSAFFNGSKDA